MKKYPKKYYAKSHTDASFVGKASVLATSYISSYKPCINDVINAIKMQVNTSYLSDKNTVHAIFISCDPLLAIADGVDSVDLHAIAHRSYQDIHRYLSALWLFDSHATHIVNHDISYRYFLKQTMQSLYDTGVLVSENVSYFWDYSIGCSVADQDVSRVPRPRTFHRIRCFIDSKKNSIIVFLPDIHLLFGIVAVAVNPEDRRYKKMVGKDIIIPLINKIVPIVADESISPNDFNGIVPVIPGHDRVGLALAKRHQLPQDIFAIDSLGVFSDHAAIYAGKHYSDFSSNIIQYLKDIHNYDGSESISVDVPFCEKTQSYLGYFLRPGWLFRLDAHQQKLLDFISSDSFSLSEDQKDVLRESISEYDDSIVSASHGVTGIGLLSNNIDPFVSIVSLEKSFVPGARALAAVIIDMIYDGLLAPSFSVEDCVDVLFADTHDLGSQYIGLLQTIYAKDKKIVKDIAVLSDIFVWLWTWDPAVMEQFVDMIDTLPILDKDTYNYTLCHDCSIDSQAKLSFDFVQHISSVYMRQQGLRNANNRFVMGEKNLLSSFISDFVVSDVLWHTQASRTISSQHSTTAINKRKSFKQLCIEPLQYHASDTLRLALVHGNIDDIQQHELIVQKVWNVCRYVYMDVIASGTIAHASGSMPIDVVQKDAYQLTPFDQWILYAFMEMYQKLHDLDDVVFPLENRIQLIQQCIVDDFAIKYIEVVKQRKGPISHWVMLLCVHMICDLMEPVFPGMIQQIRNLFADVISGPCFIQDIRIPSKNYKIHLLMLIVGSLRKMKSKLVIKNHELVSICVQWSTDIVQFIKDNRSLLDAIVRIHDIDFITLDQDISSDYLQDHVVDIALWLKLYTPALPDIDRLYIILKEKNEYLQHLRALVSASQNPDKVLKIDKLKKEIGELEYKIMKEKQKW